MRAGFLCGAHELAVRQAAREHEGVAVTLGGGAVNRGAARVVQAEQSSNLIVGLACGIIEGRAEQTHIGGNVAHLQDFGMAARNQQRTQATGTGIRQQVGAVLGAVILKQTNANVGDQVVNAVEGLAGGNSERLCRGDTDHECASQAGARGDGDSVHLIEGDVRFGECRLEGGNHGVQVSAGGDFGDHAAKAHVLFHGGGDGVAEQLCTAHNADTGLIAGGFDAQNEGFASAHSSSFCCAICA